MPVVPLTIRVEQEYRSTGSATATNVLHFVSIGGDFTQSNIDDLVTAWTGAISPVINANWRVIGTPRVLNLASDPPGELFADTTDNTGGVSGSALPPACCAVLSLSAGASRRRRGRIYLPGMTESQWTDDGIAGTGVAAGLVDAIGNAITDAASAAGYVEAVYSRTDGVARTVQTVSVNSVLDTQRRRQERLNP